MPGGDFAFEGKGPTGSVFVGVERKTISDMVNSIRTGRLSGHQLIEMMTMYNRYYVVVEGIWGPGSDGLIEIPRRVNGKTAWVPLQIGGQRYMYSMVDRYMSSLEDTCGIRFRRTSNAFETAHCVSNIYHELNKPWDERTAHDMGHQEQHLGIVQWTFARKVASTLTGVGNKWSKAIEKHFGSAYECRLGRGQGGWAKFLGQRSTRNGET